MGFVPLHMSFTKIDLTFEGQISSGPCSSSVIIGLCREREGLIAVLLSLNCVRWLGLEEGAMVTTRLFMCVQILATL